MDSHHPDILYWLAATRLPGIGPVRINRWLERFEDIKALFSATSAELNAIGLSSKEISALRQPDWETAKRDLAWGEQSQCALVAINDPSYPMLLREIYDAPLVLYVKGKVDCLSQSQVAIVGSRHPTPNGKEIAERFAYSLSHAGLVITSGLALGIDAASHWGALKASQTTIAVAGTGLNYVYPRSHKKLALEILEKGAIVSEFAPEMPPIAAHFPRRNRIISGLSLGVLVVEAAVRSGSLITARCAIEQGREVFAIPGSIHNPLARGCHQLIQQGAKLTETVEEVLEEFHMLKKAQVAVPPAVIKPTHMNEKFLSLLACVGYEATSLDTIIIRSGLTASEVSSILLSLELNGSVRLIPGGYILTP